MERLREILARMTAIQTEIREAEEAEARHAEDAVEHPLPDDHAERVTALSTEFDELDTERAPLQERQTQLDNIRTFDAPEFREEGDATRDVPNFNRNEDPFDLNTVRFDATPADLRARAITAVEAIPADYAGDTERQQLVARIEGATHRGARRVYDERGVIPGMILRMGSPAYNKAFMMGVTGQEAQWNQDERDAMRAATEYRAHMSLTDGAGGYGVPVTLDPSLIFTDDGSANPYRNIARVVTITNDEWRGLSTAGVTAGYGAEAVEATDNSPTRGLPLIKAEKAHAFVASSIELTQDYAGLAADLRMEFQDAKDDLEADKFTNGSGTNEPTGITTALDGGTSEIAPATAETLAFADFYTTLGNVPPKARAAAARTAWVMNNGTMLEARQLGHALTSAVGTFVNPIEGQPGQFLGYEYQEASALDDSSAINPAASADNFVAVVGDWRKFVIVDRVGMTIEFIPHLFGTTANLPTGERGWYAYWRSGSDSVADGHFAMLSIPTTA